MSKKLVDEDGKTYVQKKPVYKRVWFWILVVVIVIIATASMGSSNNKATKVDSTNKSQSSKQNAGKASFKVGDTIKANGVTLKVNKVEFNDGSSISKPDNGKSYVIINVTITNVDKSKISYNPLDFTIDDKGNQNDLTEEVMDDNGNNIVNDELKYGSLSKGATVTGTLIGQAVKTDKLQLLYTGSLFSDESKITVDLN